MRDPRERDLPSIDWTVQRTRLDPGALALDMARARAPDGTVVKGSGAPWAELSFSVILRPRHGLKLPLLAPIATFCASEGIRKDTGIITWIRLPDRVVTGEKVVATTSLTLGDGTDDDWAVLTFRVNRRRVRQAGCTSLEELLGVVVDADMLMSKILDSLSWMHSGWVKEMYPQLLLRISSMREDSGRSITLNSGGKQATR
jgi:biotin-(acetyl-CoA carboxylase) ligase